jgi:hypothetical protein
MPKNYVAREHGLENGFENVYDVLHWDKEDNPVVLKKRVREHVGGSHTSSRKIYQWNCELGYSSDRG